jgi:hypothetical protein
MLFFTSHFHIFFCFFARSNVLNKAQKEMFGNIRAVCLKPAGQRTVNDMSYPSSLQFLEDVDCQYSCSIWGIHVMYLRTEDAAVLGLSRPV